MLNLNAFEYNWQIKKNSLRYFDECIIKLVDFGISRYYNNPNIDKFLEHSFIDNLYENKLSSEVGTILFTVPEIINGESYNYKIDLYSLGVTLYYLIFNEYPY